MKLIRSIVIGSLIALGLSGCSTFKQHSSGLLEKGDSAYLKAQSTQTLQIPAGLSSSNVGDEFLIPPVTTQGPVPASIVPPGGISKKVPPGYIPPVTKQSSSNYFLKPLFK